MKRIYLLGALAATVLCLACGSKGGGRQGEAAGGCGELCGATDDGEAAIEVAYTDVVPTTPPGGRTRLHGRGRAHRPYDRAVRGLGRRCYGADYSGAVIELDRRIVAYAHAYLERSDEEFETFCRLLDVDPDHMRRGFEYFGLEKATAASSRAERRRACPDPGRNRCGSARAIRILCA